MNGHIECRNTIEKGDGYYANCLIRDGTVILIENVKILVNCNKKFTTSSLWLIYLVYQNKKLKEQFINKFVPFAIDELCRSKEQIKSMITNIGNSKLQKFFDGLTIEEIQLAYDKIKRNCFECDGKKFIVFDGTKFNHSCNANVDYYFNKDTNVLQFCTNRLINKGEELTIQYLDHTFAKNLLYKTYGFNCDCETCDKLKSQSI